MTLLRRRWLPGVVLAGLALIGLFIAGSTHVMRRVAVLRVPDAAPVAVLKQPQRACQGPVTAADQVQGVGIFGDSPVGISRVTVEVQDAADNRTIASGRLTVTGARQYVARLNRDVPGSRALRICVTSDLNTFVLLGSTTDEHNVVMAGHPPGVLFALVLVNDRHSLLSSLPTAFSRASLWRFSWVGSWTFWVLLAAVVASFGVGVVAVAAAASEEDGDEPAPRPDPEDDLPPDGGERPEGRRGAAVSQ